MTEAPLKRNILMVDNDPVILKMMSGFLIKHGHQVIIAKDGISAIGVIKDFSPDLILIDLIMPNISGDRLCRIFRTIPKLDQVYMVIVSGVALEEKLDYKAIGADACIPKGPFNILSQKILEVVESDLSRQSTIDTDALEVYHRKISTELLASKYHFETILNHLNDGILELTADLEIVFANPQAAALTQISEEQLLGSKIFDLFDPPQQSQVKQLLEASIAKSKRMLIKEPFRYKGKFVYLHILPFKMTDRSHLIIIIRDITELTEKELALKKSEEKYRELFEKGSDLLCFHDLEGNILETNIAFKKQYGWNEIDFARINLKDLLPDKYKARFEEYLKEVKEKGTVQGIMKALTKDGDVLLVEYSNDLVTDAKGNPIGVKGCGRDVTKRIRAEKENIKLQKALRQVHKMEAISTLAGGIAHDFNNLLMGIQGYASLIMLEAGDHNIFHSHLKAIENLITKGSELSSQLLGFARGGKYNVRPIDVNKVVQTTSELFAHSRMHLRLELNLQDQVWPIEADKNQIEQVLFNLYLNSSQAMPHGGCISIETENIVLDDSFVKPYDLVPGQYVRVMVKDTGTGIEEHIQHKIFDPFFTTKDMTRGTGLGLSSAYGIVKNHNGIIDIFSEIGQGTVITIYLPATRAASTEDKQGKDAILRGNETILLVDNEEKILMVGQRLLESLGYKVYTAQDGETALDRYSTDKDHIDLVIMDIIMPIRGGEDAYIRLKQIDPDVKIILASSFSITDLIEENVTYDENLFIQKPYNIERLSQKIREVLDNV